MQETADYPITVSICLSEGSVYNQPLAIDSDGAQCFIDWFRDPKAGPVWTWYTPSERKIILIHRQHIVSADIYGYMQIEGESSKWYQRLMYKIQAWFMTGKGGERFGKSKLVREERQGIGQEAGH